MSQVAKRHEEGSRQAKTEGASRKAAARAEVAYFAGADNLAHEKEAAAAAAVKQAEAERVARKAKATRAAKRSEEAARAAKRAEEVLLAGMAQPESTGLCLSYGEGNKLKLAYGKAPEAAKKSNQRQRRQAAKSTKTESVPSPRVPESDGIAQKVRRYSIGTKDTITKAKSEISIQVRSTGSEVLSIYHDGYLCMKSAAEDGAMFVKTKIADPIQSGALSVCNSSKARMDPAVQKLKPYYVKIQNGIAHVVGTIDNHFVVVKVRMYGASMKVMTINSLDSVRAVLHSYTSPLLNKAISLRQSAATKVDQILVSIRDGSVYVKGQMGQQILRLQTKLSETAFLKRPFALTTQLLKMVSGTYGKGRDALKVLQCSIKDRFLYVACLANDRVVVVRIKVDEVAKHMRSTYASLYAQMHAQLTSYQNSARTSLAGACGGAKMTILNATEITRTKAAGASTNIRSVAADPDARAAAAGAVVCGTGGGVTGLLAGGAVGAVCALPAAFFTFGLSVPVGAAVGAGGGLCVGGSAGLVAGGVAGYKARSGTEAIGKGIGGAVTQVKVRKDQALDTASMSASYLRSRFSGR